MLQAISMNSPVLKQKKPSLRYIDDFMNLKCAPDLLLMKVFPNAKEITESMAMYWNAVKYICDPLNIRRDDSNVFIYVVGDGKHPRTGATFAFRSAWNVISIDPGMDGKWISHDIARLKCYRFRIESLSFDHADNQTAIIVLPHSHATLYNTLSSITGRNRHLITMPCCVEHDISGVEPDLIFNDPKVFSKKNTFKIWRNI